MKNTSFKDIQLSPHFRLSEFLNLGKYPDNIPTMQAMVNMTYGCLTLLEPARQQVDPIIINSGYRNEEVNRKVGLPSPNPATMSASGIMDETSLVMDKVG